MSAENLMNQTITIQRPSFGQDSSFGVTETFTNVYTSVRANIQDTKTDVIVAYQQRQQKVETTIYTTQMLTLQNGDQVLWGSVKYKIVGVRNFIHYNRVLAIDCIRMIGAT